MVAILFAGAATAQPLAQSFVEEEEISVDAEEISYDQRSDTIIAFGNVIVRRGDLQLEAEEIRISRSTNEANARGDVFLSTPGGTYEAEEIYLNLDDETGFLRHASLESNESQFTLLGDYIEKRPGQCYRIVDGSFTTCRCAEGPPSWSIASDELEIELDGYGTIKGGTFNVLGVPVLYIPWAFFPITTERQSGLLGPRFGASDRRGFQILQPYYWAINKSHDLTLALDVETSARVGVVAEHRYAFSRDIDGSLGATYFNESFRGNPEGLSLRERIPENRWSVQSDHSHRGLAGGELYVDAFIVGDDGFLREMNVLSTDHTRDVALRTLQFTDSRVGFMRPWERFFIKAEGTYYQDLDLAGIVEATPTPEGGSGATPAPTPIADEPRSDTLTLQRAPAIEAFGQARVAGPLLADVSTSVFSYQRGESTDGVRFDLEPSLTLALPLGSSLFGNLQASVRETAYHLFETEESETIDLGQNPTREIFTVRAHVGTAAARVYPTRFAGLDAIQHLIEPRLEYLYVPDVDQSDLPMFDNYDRVGARNLFTYGVLTRVLGRFQSKKDGKDRPGARVRELGRLWVAQSVDIERQLPSVAENVEQDDHFSDIDIGAALHPVESLSVVLDSKFDHGATDLTAARIGLFVENPWEDEDDASPLGMRSRAGVTYRFLTGDEVKEIDGSLELRVARWLGLLFATRYDVVDSQFLDQYYGLRLLSRCDCWALDLGFADRTNPDEIEAKVELTLLGLGYGSPFSFDAGR